tara:strand:- start:1838 stop:2017 length:180 start_codon:yes stop_codon:yes gene_type:complete
MKTYVLTIEYNEETEEIEYLTEEILTEEITFYYGEIDQEDYWDEETAELFRNGYIHGET